LLELEDGLYYDDPRSWESVWGDNIFGWFVRDQIRREHPAMLTLLSQLVAVAQVPEPKRTSAVHQLLEEIGEQDRTKELAAMWVSALEKVNDSCLGKHACLRCMTVAIAAECYRRANKSWPKSLDKLCPQFLASVPLDPFDGEPLRYRRLEDGVVIYSVSSDRIDNHGNLDRQHPNQSGKDIGCRLWDVAKRRQPPPPKPPASNPE
jgi:hypothetical protein